MSLLYPDLMVDNIFSLTAGQLLEAGCKAILLDVDNTLTTHDNPQPADGVVEWLEEMKSGGLELIIVSNNKAQRVKLFANLLGLDFVSRAAKPLPIGFARACRRLGIKKSEAAVIGDQVFTDILGGNLLGAYTILTQPFEAESSLSFRIRRRFEVKIRNKMRAKRGECQ